MVTSCGLGEDRPYTALAENKITRVVELRIRIVLKAWKVIRYNSSITFIKIVYELAGKFHYSSQ
jgi:hypothetical protein